MGRATRHTTARGTEQPPLIATSWAAWRGDAPVALGHREQLRTQAVQVIHRAAIVAVAQDQLIARVRVRLLALEATVVERRLLQGHAAIGRQGGRGRLLLGAPHRRRLALAGCPLLLGRGGRIGERGRQRSISLHLLGNAIRLSGRFGRHRRSGPGALRRPARDQLLLLLLLLHHRTLLIAVVILEYPWVLLGGGGREAHVAVVVVVRVPAVHVPTVPRKAGTKWGDSVELSCRDWTVFEIGVERRNAIEMMKKAKVS